MIESIVLASGSFGPDDVEVVFVERSERRTTPEMVQQIDACWEELLRDSREKGKTIYNGNGCRVESLAMTSSTSCRVIFAPIDFKTRMCLPKVPGYYLLGDAYYRKGAYAAALVKTSDNFYVFVTLSGLSLNKNTVDMLGGIVGDDMPVRSGADLFEVMYKEMEEEGAIPKESVEKCVLRVVFLNQKTNVGFYFDVQLKDTMAQIEERYQKLGKDTDISGLLFVQEADLPTQLESMGGSKTFLKRVYFDD